MAGSASERRTKSQPWERRSYDHIDEEGEAREVASAGGVVADSSDEGEHRPRSKEEAATEFLHKLTGVIPAKTAAGLGFWASEGGVVGPGGDIAVPPTSDGGTASRKFDEATGMREDMREAFYLLKVPGYAVSYTHLTLPTILRV